MVRCDQRGVVDPRRKDFLLPAPPSGAEMVQALDEGQFVLLVQPFAPEKTEKDGWEKKNKPTALQKIGWQNLTALSAAVSAAHPSD